MTKPASNNTLYAVAGNSINVMILATSLVYASVVLANSPLLDQEWKKKGFCIKDMDEPYWSSFDTCLYVDTFFSIILGILYMSWKSKPGMETASELVPMIIASTLGHGFAHGAMAAKIRDGSIQEMEDYKTPLWLGVTFYVVFWFPLLKAALHRVANSYLAIAAAVVTYTQLYSGLVQKEFQFGYVQTVVSMAFHASQLMLSPTEKARREYLTLPIANALPVVTAWFEALCCTSYFRSIGGHVWYDASIIISFIGYYMDAYNYHTGLGARFAEKKKA